MKAELISIGDELLNGQTINSNAAWMGEQLTKCGVQVKRVWTISDDEAAIVEALDVALSQADVVLITGGLGPTKDDITKKVLAAYFGGEMVIDQNVLNHVTDFFTKRGRPMLEVNTMQALVPSTCQVLFNRFGTAPGMLFEKDGKQVVSMPGVPYEMKVIMEDHVLPKLRAAGAALYQRTILIQGIGESFLANELSDWEDELAQQHLQLAYLPSPGLVKVRVGSADPAKRVNVDRMIEVVKSRFPKHCFGEEEDTLEQVIGTLLKERNQTVATAESCTIGRVGSSIASVSGASAYYKGALNAYQIEMKELILGVEPALIREKNVVSQEVVEEMAKKGRTLFGADFCLATTGVAGPTGGTDEIPVGTIWIAVAGNERVVSRRLNFGDNRERNIQMSNLALLNLFRCELLGLNE